MRLSPAPMPAWQVDAVALTAGPVRVRAVSGPARCRGMAACLSPAWLAEWLRWPQWITGLA